MSESGISQPRFRFNSRFRGITVFPLIVFVLILTLIISVVSPIPIGAILFWGGFIAAIFYSWLKTRKLIPRSARFYDDRIELAGATSTTLRYDDVVKLTISGPLGRSATFVVKGRETPFIVSGTPTAKSAEEFYTWLTQRLAGTGALIDSRVGKGNNTNPFASLFLVGLGVYMAGLLVIGVVLAEFSSFNLSTAEGLPIVPAVAAFVIFARRSIARLRLPETGGPKSISPKTKGPSVWRDGATRFFGGWKPAPLMILLLLVLATLAIVALPFLPGEYAFYLQQWNQTSASLDGLSLIGRFLAIFSNNLRLALYEMVPGIGPFIAASATYNTARTIEALSLSENLSPLAVTERLFLLPHSWLELSSYALAVYLSFRFLKEWSVWSFRGGVEYLAGLLNEFLFGFVLVASVLVIAALLETLEPQTPDPYILWLPVSIGGLMIAIIILRMETRPNATEAQ